jgi:flagellin
MWASKNLQGAQSKMADSVERLSSGLRINRAKDDAAGLGIANALTQQINGANQGVRNLNDGISMVQTAEGAIAAAQEMAQRILTLATQGANGTLGTTDRTAIQNEMKQLLSAIDSVGARTKFSGNGLLNNDARTGTGSDAAAGAAPTTEKYSLQVSNITSDKVSLSAAAFLNIGGTKGVADATVGSISSDAAFTMVMDTNATAVVSGTNQPDSVVGTTAYKKVVSSGTTTYTKIGVVASSATNGSGVQTLTFVSGQHGGWSANDTIVFSGQLTQNFSATAGDLSLSEAVQADLTTASTATAAFQMLQRAATGYITALSTQRSLLGAFQNQIEFTVSNVTELSANLAAAKSNVIDTDYATETAALTKGQILQQAATAM